MPAPSGTKLTLRAVAAFAIVMAAIGWVQIGALTAGALITRLLWAQILPSQPDLLVPIPPGWPPTVATLFIISVLTAGAILIVTTHVILNHIVARLLPTE